MHGHRGKHGHFMSMIFFCVCLEILGLQICPPSNVIPWTGKIVHVLTSFYLARDVVRRCTTRGQLDQLLHVIGCLNGGNDSDWLMSYVHECGKNQSFVQAFTDFSLIILPRQLNVFSVPHHAILWFRAGRHVWRFVLCGVWVN